MTLAEQAAAFSQAEIVALLEQNADLKRQVEWFKRQLFGQKSERRLLSPDSQQLSLTGLLPPTDAAADTPPSPTETVRAYQRRVQGKAGPDEIVINAATQRLVAGPFETEDQGRHELKGITTPQPLYRVTAESAAQSRFEVTVQTGLTP